MQKLDEKWKTFLIVLFEPWNFVLLIITISILVFSLMNIEQAIRQTNKFLFVTFPILIALLTTILGSRITKQWSDIADEKEIVSRGVFAIRNLKLLFTNLTILENRIKTYLNRQNSKDHSTENSKIYYEEIFEKCIMMEEEIINSIEDWVDIIPEANIKSQIEVLNDLKLALLISEKEIDRFNNELLKTKGQSKKEIQELKFKIEEQEKVIFQLREKLLEKKQNLDNSILSGVSTSILLSDTHSDPKLLSVLSSLHTTGHQGQNSTNSINSEKSDNNDKVKSVFKNISD